MLKYLFGLFVLSLSLAPFPVQSYVSQAANYNMRFSQEGLPIIDVNLVPSSCLQSLFEEEALNFILEFPKGTLIPTALLDDRIDIPEDSPPFVELPITFYIRCLDQIISFSFDLQNWFEEELPESMTGMSVQVLNGK